MAKRNPGPPACLNCGEGLAGQYCGQCGQRASNRLISLWELLRDAFGDLFELDSRLWRTIVPLLGRPGLLTLDYLEGRRARYMPPFRMYLVLSLVFFVVAFFDPRQELAILFEPAEPELAQLQVDERKQATREALEELVNEGVLDESVLDRAALQDDIPEPGNASDMPAPSEPGAGDERPFGIDLDGDGDDAACVAGKNNFDFAPEFIQRRFSEERLNQVCERVVAVGAGGVMSALLDKVPAALIILLPLMALVLKLLYPLSRRYYVEHLLFFVHFHAFLFLLLTLQILWTRLVHVASAPDAVAVLPVVATSFYVPAYLYKSMRRVYRQGRTSTILKFIGLAISYLAGFTLMMLSALLIAVFSV